jgi:glycosyltransferase involved in cell wall biosynthesis
MSDFNPLVSIVIPVYNGSDFMREAIDSALAQTYDNIEVLVINDGSTDDGETERIGLSYGNRIRYFSKINGGVTAALNLGILEMRGDYLSWLSHDDLYIPEKVERQVKCLASSLNRDAIIFSDYMNVNENNKDLYPVCMDHDLLNEKPLYAVFRGSLHGCTLIVPRSAFISSGIFNNLRTTQDYDLWFRMIRNHIFIHMPEILVRSRLHPNQGSRHLDATAEANELWIHQPYAENYSIC